MLIGQHIAQKGPSQNQQDYTQSCDFHRQHKAKMIIYFYDAHFNIKNNQTTQLQDNHVDF